MGWKRYHFTMFQTRMVKTVYRHEWFFHWHCWHTIYIRSVAKFCRISRAILNYMIISSIRAFVLYTLQEWRQIDTSSTHLSEILNTLSPVNTSQPMWWSMCSIVLGVQRMLPKWVERYVGTCKSPHKGRLMRKTFSSYDYDLFLKPVIAWSFSSMMQGI